MELIYGSYGTIYRQQGSLCLLPTLLGLRLEQSSTSIHFLLDHQFCEIQRRFYLLTLADKFGVNVHLLGLSSRLPCSSFRNQDELGLTRALSFVQHKSRVRVYQQQLFSWHPHAFMCTSEDRWL